MSHSGDYEDLASVDAIVDIEPGACSETIFVNTDTFEAFAKEMSSSLSEPGPSTINEIQSQNKDLVTPEVSASSESFASENLGETSADSGKLETADHISTNTLLKDSDDCLNNPEWKNKDKHVLVLSSAGKPIYSRYGNEDKLAGLCGIIQALMSVVQDQNADTLRSIYTEDCKTVFLIKGPLIFALVSKTNESETQLVLQLTYAYNQIISVLTLTQLNRIFEQRRNYDLRRLLSGAERLIDQLLIFMERDPALLVGAVRCLPLPSNARETITSAIISACSKIKDLVFAILLAGNQLITLVRMKKYVLHPSDIHILVNLVLSSESFKTAESWTPICLPKFDSSGFLHGHVSYLSDDCQACLILLTVQRDAFFILQQAKNTITEKLRRSNCLVAINDSINRSKEISAMEPLKHIGVPEIRHFMYKCKSTAQLFTSDPIFLDTYKNNAKFNTNNSAKQEEQSKKINEMDYVSNYRKLCSQIHHTVKPAKLIYRMNSSNTLLAWITNGFELYITFDTLIEKNLAILAVDKLLRWIKKEEDKIFIMNAPTF